MSDANDSWGTRTGFVLAAIGSAIGLGNIWRFPYQVYDNGGGAFLLPYLAALLLAGIPVLILEIGLGSETGKTTPMAIREKIVESEFLGWWAVLNSYLVNMYYVVILGWAVMYIPYSMTLAWGANPNDFFFGEFLTSWWPLVGAVLIWGINYAVVRTGVEDGLERVNVVLVPAIWLIVVALAIRGLTLPGGIEGLNFYLTPDFGALTDPQIWLSAFGQIYFTLSVGLAIMITYASYQPEGQDVSNNAFIIAFANSGFAFLAGFAIFPVLAATGTEPTQSIGLAFVVLPEAFEAIPLSEIVATLFFLLLTLAGLSSSLSLAEAQVGPIQEKLDVSRQRATNWIVGVGALGSALIAAEGPLGLLAGDNPLNLLVLLDTSSATFTLPLIAFGEALIFGWVYGADRIREHANEVSDFHIGPWFDWTLRVVVPLALGYSILSSAVDKPGLLAPFLIVLSAVLASLIKDRREDVVTAETPDEPTEATAGGD
jgi:NSS family neurotransmitter:Na+ symporter